jgi:hypothetical protein
MEPIKPMTPKEVAERIIKERNRFNKKYQSEFTRQKRQTDWN